jgi:hypothetical protein
MFSTTRIPKNIFSPYDLLSPCTSRNLEGFLSFTSSLEEVIVGDDKENEYYL